MNKTHVLLFMLVFFASCGKPATSSDNEQASPETITPDEPSLDKPDFGVPTAALTFNTNLTLVNFSVDQEDKVLEAAELVKKVIASEEFKNAVINHIYNGQKTFVDNNGLTNTQIYNVLLKGAETLSPAKNNAMDVELELYYDTTTTIGYTYADSKRIWMNTKYFDNYTPVKVAGNLFHEWVHKLGFGHAAVFNAARPYSVPYALGYLLERMAAGLNVP